MKTSLTSLVFGLLLCLFANESLAQGSAFTYQGRLNNSSTPATGSYDFRFRLASDSLGNTYVGSAVLTNGVMVTNGLFTVTLDFGTAAFNGASLWLQVDVRTNGAGSYNTLTPLQPLSPAPYAITAGSTLSLVGSLPATQLSGTIPSANFTGTYGAAISLTNTANQFSGNGANLSNVNASLLGGLDKSNFWQMNGNTVGGSQFLGSINNQAVDLRAGNQRALRLEPNISSNAPNVVGGSSWNSVSNGVVGATIAGGGGSGTYYYYGGYYPASGNFTNKVTADFATIGGGGQNVASGPFATIAGGNYNNATNRYCTVGGGYYNFAYGLCATVAGGAGYYYGNFANGDYSAIGGGSDNFCYGNVGVIAGGYFNFARSNSYGVAIGGGSYNSASNNYSTISGGAYNTVTGTNATVGGGKSNLAATNNATVAGGEQNSALGPWSFIGGGSQNQSGRIGYDVIGGGEQNVAGTNSGGFNFIGGGSFNQANGGFSTVGGGYGNSAPGYIATVGGGGGYYGGDGNTASGNWSTVGGGYFNTASGQESTIPGGSGNTASGSYSFAAGYYAHAAHSGAFVWSDGSGGGTFTSTGNNQFLIRAAGGVGIGTNNPAQKLHVIGNILASGTITGSSDRNVKENFKPVQSRDVLNKVASLPISEWNYIDDKKTPHIGPMAQDFYAAFAVGMDDKHISMVDADGVALAAIQGLNEVVKEKDARISALEQRLEKLEQLLSSQIKQK